jgi:hypothetical protein
MDGYRWRGVGPEDRERWIEVKRISRNSILGSYPSVAPGWLHRYYQQTGFSEDLDPCVPNGSIQAEHVNGVK